MESMRSRIDARRVGHRPLVGVALLVAAFLSATACGSNTSADNVGITVSTHVPTTPSPAPTTTTTVAASVSVTSAPPTPTSAANIPTTTAIRSTAARDELVGVESRLHIRCVGRGTTTVLLIAGFEEGAENWNKIEPPIAASARVCSYDRPGTGTSDPPTSTQTFATQAKDLHALLTTVGEPGPYVVVGHSFGGVEAVTFASLYPTEVAGLVLVDTSPVTWPAVLRAVSDDGTETAGVLRSFGAGMSDPTKNAEHLDVLASFAEASAIASVGSVPMAVITAVERQYGGLGASELARLTDLWNQGQQQWRRLSSAAHVVSVDNTSHHIQLDRPDVVIDEITRLLPSSAQ
jgi:pimeloyl-ACP methyl ester carboxylesterase